MTEHQRPQGQPLRAILTGASGGIGSAIAARLAGQGVALLLVGRQARPLAAMASELGHHGVEVQWLDADITTSAGRARLLAVATSWRPNLLIHNAGTSQFGWLVDQDEATIERQLQLNLVAPALLDRALLPLLLAQPQAQIIHVGSVFGSLGFAGFAPYCASKGGLRLLAEALRRELADSGVMVSYLGPRATATSLNSPQVVAMNRSLGNAMDAPALVADALWQMVVQRTPEQLLGQPESFFARLNQLWPRLVDRALRGKLATIRRFAQGLGDLSTTRSPT